ncbi:hypothetical protein ACFW3D_37695 [Streptomyces sp. NPDC058864]
MEQLTEADETMTDIKPGQFVFINNTRRSAGKLTDDRPTELDALDMRR